MASKAFSFTKLISRILLKFYRNQNILQRNLSNSKFKLEKQFSFAQNKVPSQEDIVIFNVEGALLKSSSIFSYFMLVAFEAGSLLRVLFLFLLYPLICVVNEEASLQMMVMVCFFGINKDKFRVGSGVLPKFFLEDVGLEGFEVVKRGGTSVGVSDLPQVMVECFLKDYLEIDFVIGRDLKVCCGYFVGIMEDRKNIGDCLDEIIFEDDNKCCDLIGISCSNKSFDRQSWSTICKEIYLVNETEKKSWHSLPKEKYSKSLIFHDGRLAFKPTPLATIAMLMWFPLGLALTIIRAIIASSLPFSLATPILAFTGMQLKLTKPKHSLTKPNKGNLYACNHRTLMDPVFVSFCLKKPLTAVTYSLSRISELLAPIRTVRLTRDRDQDREMMEKMLSKGDLVVCPEGTTCREPYLLWFSPLFTELTDEIVPIGITTEVSMFYGTTAGGLKCLDPLFFLLNPCPCYNIQFLESISGAAKSASKGGLKAKFEVANNVQSEIGRALGFECTELTRKDKYLILAGNEGIVPR